MPKRRKNKNQGAIAPTMPGFATGFDPSATYGRTKKDPFLSTSAGHHAINQDHPGYLGYAARRGGINMSGSDPFTAWLKNTKFAEIEDDYNAATKINPELSFAHYTQTMGIPGDPANLRSANGGMAINTGNTYTSSSGVAPVAAGPAAAGKKGKKGKNKPPAFNQYAQGVVQANSMDNTIAKWRHDFSKLTPEQQGTMRQGYAFGPAGWSVY